MSAAGATSRAAASLRMVLKRGSCRPFSMRLMVVSATPERWASFGNGASHFCVPGYAAYGLLRDVQPHSWPSGSHAVYGPAVEYGAHDLRLFCSERAAAVQPRNWPRLVARQATLSMVSTDRLLAGRPQHAV